MLVEGHKKDNRGRVSTIWIRGSILNPRKMMELLCLSFMINFRAGSGSGSKFYLDPDLDLESNPDLKLDTNPDPKCLFRIRIRTIISDPYRSGSEQ